MSKEENCQLYFAVSKKMPKDVKRHCGMCRQHGMLVETRGHLCSWKNCNCSKCLLIRQRRQIMRTQIRLRRAQDKIFQRTSVPTQATIIPQNCSEKDDSTVRCSENGPSVTSITAKNQCYICQKCKNHGMLVWKKEHKRHCLYANCTCEQCELIERRRKLDQILKCTSNFKPSSTHKKEKQIRLPARVKLAASTNMSPILTNWNKQLVPEQCIPQNDAGIPTPQLNSITHPLFATKFHPVPRTDFTANTSFGDSVKPNKIPQDCPVFPIPLKPHSVLLPAGTTNAPTVYGMYSSAGALMNTLAAMHFALGIF